MMRRVAGTLTAAAREAVKAASSLATLSATTGTLALRAWASTTSIRELPLSRSRVV